MSNLGQFYGSGYPIGSGINLMYGGDLLTASDGTQWLTASPTAPFAYTSDYSYLPDYFISPHPLMNGWENGLFRTSVNSIVISYSPSSGVYCTNAVVGTSGIGYYYYTSSDGVNWTQRLFPNNTVNYALIVYVAGKFFAVASGTTTNAIIYSTDAINWTSASLTTGASTPSDIVYNGTNLVLVGTGTAAAYSTDLGVTWTNVTLPSTPINSAGTPGAGAMIWSQSAGLFIYTSTTNGTYGTSPDGITWTNRSAVASFAIYAGVLTNAARVAASASIIVAMGTGGFYLTSTDGLTWSSPGYISGISGANCNQFFYDGTRFVAKFNYGIYYSTNGTTWIAARQIGSSQQNVASSYSNGIWFVFCSTPGTVSSPTKLFKVTNVTLTSPQTISVPLIANTAAGGGAAATYYRIR